MIAPAFASLTTMPRRKVDLYSEFPYHVGGRCINRDWFSLPMPFVWEVMSEQLHFIHHSYGIEIHAFVLMNNHFHLLLRAPKRNLSEAMSWFMRETSRTLTRSGNRINQTYGGRFFRSILGRPLYYQHAYKYLYLNPVKAEIVRHPLDYPYSTLPGLLGRHRLLIPVNEDQILFSGLENTLKWLEQRPREEDWKAVGRALTRSEFRLAPVNQRKHPLETDRF